MSIKDDFNQKRQDEYDCCGCSKPWVLFDELLERAEAVEAEVKRLRAALREITHVLGPDLVCDCDAHECGLTEEAVDALGVAVAALAQGVTRKDRIAELRSILQEKGKSLPNGI